MAPSRGRVREGGSGSERRMTNTAPAIAISGTEGGGRGRSFKFQVSSKAPSPRTPVPRFQFPTPEALQPVAPGWRERAYPGFLRVDEHAPRRRCEDPRFLRQPLEDSSSLPSFPRVSLRANIWNPGTGDWHLRLQPLPLTPLHNFFAAFARLLIPPSAPPARRFSSSSGALHTAPVDLRHE